MSERVVTRDEIKKSNMWRRRITKMTYGTMFVQKGLLMWGLEWAS